MSARPQRHAAHERAREPAHEGDRASDDGRRRRGCRRARRIAPWSVMLAGAVGCTAAGCERQPSRRAASPARPAETAPSDHGETAPGASRPAPGGPRIDARCIVPFPEDRCPPAVGFPAISTDGGRVAVVDRGPDTGWGGLLLTVREVAAGGERVAEWPVVTADDHEAFATDDQGAFGPAFAPVLAARLAPVEAALAEGRFRPLIDLGAVHPAAPGAPVQGMQAAYEAGVLTVTDAASGAILWQRAIGPSSSWRPPGAEPDRVCGPFPVGEVHVWVSREPRVAVVQVTYVGSDLCSTEWPYLILR